MNVFEESGTLSQGERCIMCTFRTYFKCWRVVREQKRYKNDYKASAVIETRIEKKRNESGYKIEIVK